MAGIQVLEKLKSYHQQLDAHAADSVFGQDAPTATIDEFRQTKKLLSDASSAIEQAATKLTLLAGSDSSNDAATESMHKAFVQPLEGFVTIGYVFTSTDFGLCEIYRSFLLRAVRGVSSASLTLMQTVLAYEKSEEDRATLRSQVLLETSVLHAKCKHVRLLPVSNSSAVIREVLQTAVVCKDMVKEFTELVETAAGGEGGAELPEGRSEEEVEIGSDEWYALMDSLAGDNACTAEEATTIKEEVKIVNAVYSLLRCVSNMIKLTDDSSDREEQQRYRSWLEETIRLDRVLKDNLTDLGVLLNPPHDSSLQEKAVSVKKQALALAMHIHKHTVNESRRQHTCFQRFEEFVHALD